MLLRPAGRGWLLSPEFLPTPLELRSFCGGILRRSPYPFLVVRSFRQRYDSRVDIALVGFTRSYNDLQWLEMVRVWAAAHEPAMAEAWATATQKVFDLRGGAGRNFLDDGGEYEVVVL